MGIKINLSGSNIGGDSEVLSNLTINGASNGNVEIKNSNISGNAQVLNDMTVSNSEISLGVNSSTIEGNAHVMNNIDATNSKVIKNISNVNLRGNATVFNNAPNERQEKRNFLKALKSTLTKDRNYDNDSSKRR